MQAHTHGKLDDVDGNNGDPDLGEVGGSEAPCG
jgi:hypothetical protein